MYSIIIYYFYSSLALFIPSSLFPTLSLSLSFLIQSSPPPPPPPPSFLSFFLFLQTHETFVLITTILDVQPRLASSGGGKTNDEIVYDLAENILQRIPDGLDLDKAEESLFAVRIMS